jgi:hypothetical protein
MPICHLKRSTREASSPSTAILSPGNTEAEIREKVALYFDAGAREVWLCAASGVMEFVAAGGPKQASALCPRFPKQVELP